MTRPLTLWFTARLVSLVAPRSPKPPASFSLIYTYATYYGGGDAKDDGDERLISVRVHWRQRIRSAIAQGREM